MICWLLSLLVFGGVWAMVLTVGRWVVHDFSENSLWQIERLVERGDLAGAEMVARGQVDREHYDFQGHRALAGVLLAQGKPSQAVDILLMSIDRMADAQGRGVYNLGADVGETYRLLEEALGGSGRVVFQGEVGRIRRDTVRGGVAAVSGGMGDEGAGQADTLEGRGLALDLGMAKLSGEVRGTDSGGLIFTGNSSATMALVGEGGAMEAVEFSVRGGKVMGMGGILKVELDGAELLRIYADSEEARVVRAGVPEDWRGTNFKELRVSFINDGFDSVSRADRNVELLSVEMILDEKESVR